MRNVTLLIVICFLLSGCWPFYVKKQDGKFLDEVVRLDAFNSEFDDYNSTLPENKSGDIHLLFSSKRDKKDYFNLVYFPAQFSYDKRLSLNPGRAAHSDHYFDTYGAFYTLANRVNGNFNVLGPLSLSLQRDFLSDSRTKDDLALFYADDSEGNLEIKYLKNGATSEPVKVNLLNSEKDDVYPSFSYLGDKIYFCSNRAGNFDIYEVSVTRSDTTRITFENLIDPKVFTIRKMDELSSPYQDKCPYFYGKTMVFVSDRPGGQGGFDIYYSKLKDGQWSKPVNAGSRINTTANEYRPILPSHLNFNYNLMIFSSDRPGGKGGYDLYMTGLDQDRYF
jgi:hypothetical protein